MKTKTGFAAIVIALLSLVYFLNLTTTEKPLDRSQNASFYSIKCTVAKFMLGEVDTTQQISPLFENLGNLNFSISTSNKKAQTFFNQGLKLTYAFNHAEAHRSFLEAARLDKNMAMAYWGQAYALGPNINDQFPTEARRTKSFEAIQKAKSLSENSSLT